MKKLKYLFFLSIIFSEVLATWNLAGPPDGTLDETAERRSKMMHRVDSMILLMFVSLLVVIVLTAWFFKHHRFRFINETGLTLVYGLLIGLVLRFTNIGIVESQTMDVFAKNMSPIYEPPDYLRLEVSPLPKMKEKPGKPSHFHYEMVEGFFADTKESESKHMEQKTVFSPEIFFNILLPPVIFYAGYSLKKRSFFRNIGSILTFVFIGTTMSAFFIGFILYILCGLFSIKFNFQELLFFGSLLSATDPVTVLSIFSDMHVEPDLYALVFGESALNDAVAIVLSSIVDTYSPSNPDAFDTAALGYAVCNFLYVFFSSLALGAIIGCINALVTKFTQISEFPILETSLFILLSYASFLLAEVADLSGIVAVLFCGICQAHYTYNNLSLESQARSKQFFEVINFLSEGFIFCYIGVSVTTSAGMKWNFLFLVFTLIAMTVARALFVYPLCGLLNIRRDPKIPRNHQHMLVFSGLRGAVPFALASRNTATPNRQIMQATTSFVVILTVLINGGLTSWMVDYLGIKYGDQLQQEPKPIQNQDPTTEEDPDQLESSQRQPNTCHGVNPWDKSFFPRKWYHFDAAFMKPLLTNANPTLMETMPSVCQPLARVLTTKKQMENYHRTCSSGSISTELLAGADGNVSVNIRPEDPIPHL